MPYDLNKDDFEKNSNSRPADAAPRLHEKKSTGGGRGVYSEVDDSGW